MDNIYLTSPNISVKHGFFTRDGGVSTGQFATLNVKYKIGDRDENVRENQRRACRRLGVDATHLVFVNDLEHSNRVFVADQLDGGSVVNGYDAIVTAEKNMAVGLSVADCLPVILVDGGHSVAGVIHVGWRGLLAGVITSTLETFQQSFNTQLANVSAAIGPSISPQSYIVGSEVAEKFVPAFIFERDQRLYLDMWVAAEQQLRDAGVKDINNLKIDTMVDERFYSYRRDQGKTGRFLAVVSL